MTCEDLPLCKDPRHSWSQPCCLSPDCACDYPPVNCHAIQGQPVIRAQTAMLCSAVVPSPPRTPHTGPFRAYLREARASLPRANFSRQTKFAPGSLTAQSQALSLVALGHLFPAASAYPVSNLHQPHLAPEPVSPLYTTAHTVHLLTIQNYSTTSFADCRTLLLRRYPTHLRNRTLLASFVARGLRRGGGFPLHRLFC